MFLKTLITISITSAATIYALPSNLAAAFLPLLTNRAVGDSCSTPDGDGTCQATSGCTTGFSEAGYCPNDSSDVQCCVTATCSTSSGSGTCISTVNSCAGSFISGACPGPSNVECCVPGGGSTPPSGLASFDLSAAQSSSFWSCAAGQGIQKVIPRGYQQACGSGGQVDSNMVATYQAASAVGITNIDAYIFPCTGDQPTGVACKDINTQLSEFLAAIDNNNIPVTHLWFDIEPTNANAGAACNSWQLGSAGNEALAKQWVAAIKATGRNWGIYANAGQWTSMFASINTDVGSDLPLWAVQDDFQPGVSTTTRFMGGWTSAYAKQYHEATNSDSPLCGGSVDLDSFTA